MSTLRLALEIRDFDLERMGFSLSVLDANRKRESSEAYLRMTLPELTAFIKALRGAGEIEVTTLEPSGVSKLPVSASPKPDKVRTSNLGRETIAAE